jgi:hypothetical protein
LPEARRDLRDRGRRRPELACELRRRQEVPVVGRLRIGHLLHLGRQRGGIARFERDGEWQGRRRRCGPDEGGTGGNDTLMAGQLLAPDPGGDSTRRGGGTQSGRTGQHDGEPEHARDSEAQPTSDTPIDLHPCVLTAAPRVGKGNAPTRAIFRVRLLLGTRLTGNCRMVVPSLSASEASGLKHSALQVRSRTGPTDVVRRAGSCRDGTPSSHRRRTGTGGSHTAHRRVRDRPLRCAARTFDMARVRRREHGCCPWGLPRPVHFPRADARTTCASP